MGGAAAGVGVGAGAGARKQPGKDRFAAGTGGAAAVAVATTPTAALAGGGGGKKVGAGAAGGAARTAAEVLCGAGESLAWLGCTWSPSSNGGRGGLAAPASLLRSAPNPLPRSRPGQSRAARARAAQRVATPTWRRRVRAACRVLRAACRVSANTNTQSCYESETNTHGAERRGATPAQGRTRVRARETF
jgi:hypothetical protein